MHYIRRLCKHAQRNIPPGQSLLPTKDTPSEQSIPLCTAPNKQYFFTETLPEPAPLQRPPEQRPRCSRCPTITNTPASRSPPRSQAKGETPRSDLHRDTHPGCDWQVLQGAVHIYSEALSQRPREEQFPRDEHPKYCPTKTDLRGVKPLCKEPPRFAGKSTGTEVPAVVILQWKPGAGWYWVTINH